MKTTHLLIGATLGMAVAMPAAADDLEAGRKIYDANCFACHSTGAAGAPKLGDKKAWKDRVAQGMDTLVSHAIKGKGAMPPKGGAMHLKDADIRNAVAYMVSKVK